MVALIEVGAGELAGVHEADLAGDPHEHCVHRAAVDLFQGHLLEQVRVLELGLVRQRQPMGEEDQGTRFQVDSGQPVVEEDLADVLRRDQVDQARQLIALRGGDRLEMCPQATEAGDVVRGDVLRLEEAGQGNASGVAGPDAEHHREERLHHACADERAEHPQRVQRVLRGHQVDDRRGVRPEALREDRVLLGLCAVDRDDAAVAVDRVAHVSLEQHALTGAELGDHAEAGAGVGLDTAVRVAEDRGVACGADVLAEAGALLVSEFVTGKRHSGRELPAGRDLGELTDDAPSGCAGDHRPPELLLTAQGCLEEEVGALVLVCHESALGLREIGGICPHSEQHRRLNLDLLVGAVEGGVVRGQRLCDLAEVGSAAGDRRGALLMLVLLLEGGFGLLVATLDLVGAGDGETDPPVDVEGELVDV